MVELGCLSFCELEERSELDCTLSKKLVGVLRKSGEEADLQIQKLVEIKAMPAIAAAGQKKIIELA